MSVKSSVVTNPNMTIQQIGVVVKTLNLPETIYRQFFDLLNTGRITTEQIL
jgi:hypothetical protein